MEQILTNQDGSQTMNTTFFLTGNKYEGISQSHLHDQAPDAQLGTSWMTYLCIGFQVSNLTSPSSLLPWASRSPGMGWGKGCGHMLRVQTPLQLCLWKLPVGPGYLRLPALSEAQGGKSLIYRQPLRTVYWESISQEAEKPASI